MQSQNSSQKTWFYHLREAVWPLFDPEEPALPFPEETVVVEEENLDQAYELIRKFADSEQERLKTVESKATLLLSTISIATTVIVASNTLLTGKSERSWPIVCSVGISFLLCLYAIMTVWYAIKVLKRGAYNVLSFTDINRQGNKESYKRHLILSTWERTRGNFRTINYKVDYMNMSQLYYQRGIIVIGCYSLLIFIFCLFYKIDVKSSPDVVATHEKRVKKNITVPAKTLSLSFAGDTTIAGSFAKRPDSLPKVKQK